VKKEEIIGEDCSSRKTVEMQSWNKRIQKRYEWTITIWKTKITRENFQHRTRKVRDHSYGWHLQGPRSRYLTVFRRSIMWSTIALRPGCSLVPWNIAGCNLLLPVMISSLCSYGRVNKSWRRSSVYCCRLPSCLECSHQVATLFVGTATRSVRTVMIFSFSHTELVKRMTEKRVKKW